MLSLRWRMAGGGAIPKLKNLGFRVKVWLRRSFGSCQRRPVVETTGLGVTEGDVGWGGGPGSGPLQFGMEKMRGSQQRRLRSGQGAGPGGSATQRPGWKVFQGVEKW